MSKLKYFVILFVFLTSGVFGQTAIVQTYLQRFITADLLGKIEILNEASIDDALDESAVQLYEYALHFVLDNYSQIDDLHDMNSIVEISIRNLSRFESMESMNLLWQLFLEYPDIQTEVEILVTFGIMGKGNSEIVKNINDYLWEKNLLFISGESVDYKIISACISALMELGDSSSYPVIFSIICSGYPEIIAFEAYGALENIPGNLHHFLLTVIENNPPDEKFAAFRIVVESERLTISERGQLAEIALELSLLTGVSNIYLDMMRYDAVLVLSQLRWTRANALAIRNYYRVQADYSQGAVSKERLVQAILCLGAVGNSDAALALGLQLGLIHARTVSTNNYDAEITLAIVQSLGLIGDNAAFDNLLYISHLPYSENIKAAAREAVDRLRW